MERKKLKKNAKKVFKKQYLLFVLICLIASFIGSEFSSTLSIAGVKTKATNMEIEVIDKFHQKELDKFKKEKKLEQKQILKNNDNKILGRKRGVFSQIINSFDTGTIYIKVIESIYSIVGSVTITVAILIILSLILVFIFWFFFINIFRVISRRIFLEGRIYKKISSQRFLFIQKARCWFKVSKTMLIEFIFQSLWSLTIVGAIIKRYSYFLVPYIVAENPNIPSCDVITLSRNIMNGHKWECFKLELSFILWDFLGVITFGLSNIFFLNSYKISTYCEYYAYLRKEAINNKVEGYLYLNDKYLFEIASQNIIDEEYKNMIVEMNKTSQKLKLSTSDLNNFINDNLGIRLGSDAEEDYYDKEIVKYIKFHEIENIRKGLSYPSLLFTSKEIKKKKRIEVLNCVRKYSVSHLIIIFFILSFIGWLWEVSLRLIQNGDFVNRGVMYGPWLPIYGYGGLVIIIFLYKYRKTPLLHMILTILLCGFIEYFTSWYLEIIYHGQRWWDYSGYFLNINGRICAEGLLIFGLGGMAIVYLLVPSLDNLLSKIRKRKIYVICTLLISLYVIDFIVSSIYPNVGVGITNNQKYIVTNNVTSKRVY